DFSMAWMGVGAMPSWGGVLDTDQQTGGSWSSNHPGIVQFLFSDGAVHRIAKHDKAFNDVIYIPPQTSKPPPQPGMQDPWTTGVFQGISGYRNVQRQKFRNSATPATTNGTFDDGLIQESDYDQ